MAARHRLTRARTYERSSREISRAQRSLKRNDALQTLERDEIELNRHPALAFCLSMIFSESRFPLFGIML
jgi:hypothetical protein